MMERPAPRNTDPLTDHPVVRAYSEEVAGRVARAYRARPDASDAATEAFLAGVADGLEGWAGMAEIAGDPDDAAAGAERAAAGGDTSTTVDLFGRAMTRKSRKATLQTAAAETAPDAGPLTLFFVEPGTLITNELLSEAARHSKAPVLDTGSPPPGLEPIAGYLIERPSNFDPSDRSTYDYFSMCFMEALGIEDAAYLGTGLAGAPIVKKSRGGVGGPRVTTRTSVSSTSFRRLFPQRLPFRLWAPTASNVAATTASVGGLLGRWVPYVGWALLARDIIRFGSCLEDVSRGMKRPPHRGSR